MAETFKRSIDNVEVPHSDPGLRYFVVGSNIM